MPRGHDRTCGMSSGAGGVSLPPAPIPLHGAGSEIVRVWKAASDAVVDHRHLKGCLVAKYRDALPQSAGDLFLTDGGLDQCRFRLCHNRQWFDSVFRVEHSFSHGGFDCRRTRP